MSWYTTGEILVWLILAAVLGFILGWLIRSWLHSRKSNAELQKLRDENAELQRQLDECRANCGGAEAVAEPLAEPEPTQAEAVALVGGEIATRTSGDEEAPKDDLREVFGIGEVISKMLYSMHITSFRQIARFTPQDIATVAQALQFFPDRIRRDDWMSSARKLNIQHYGFDPCEDTTL